MPNLSGQHTTAKNMLAYNFICLGITLAAAALGALPLSVSLTLVNFILSLVNKNNFALAV